LGSIACASTLTNPTNGCVPYNPFGTGVVSQAAINYIVDHNDFYLLTMQEDTARAAMQGVLPWDVTGAGAPAVAFGVDYRKETLVSHADPLGALGALGGGNFVPVSAEYNIWEGYGEFDIRAPDLAELFNVIPASGGQVDYKNNVTEAVALSETAGNPNLVPETAVTISASVVMTPHWFPGLSVSVDAYSINVKDIVVRPSTTFERTSCQTGVATPTGVASNPAGFNGTGGVATGYCADWVYNAALANSSNVNGLQFLYTYPFNNGFLKTSGLDFNA